MKRIGPAIAWKAKLFSKLPRNIISAIIRCFTPVKKGRILCWSHGFRQYSCNPKALTEYMIEHYGSQYEIFWATRKGIDTSGIDKRIKCVKFKSLEYLKLINTSEFLVSNCRNHPFDIFWKKRPEQKYLMLWHGGMSLKKIEKDAEEVLSYQHPIKAKADSKVCDLMISGCRFHTQLASEKFWYEGEILEKGLPRSDIFFDKKAHTRLRSEICERYGINKDSFIVLYAPTFRKPPTIEPYRINWSEVIPSLGSLAGNKDVKILLRLHPNLIGVCDTTPLLECNNVIDVTMYPDMQELLCICNLLITDYSSTMFDMMLLKHPCLIYATDAEKYDRGYYFNLRDLPFPMATSQEELVHILNRFDLSQYLSECEKFDEQQIGFVETGQASKALAEWIVKHS